MDKGLLRETEAVQNQLSALLKCDVRAFKHARANDRAVADAHLGLG